MSKRRRMQLGDWVNAVINAAIGLFLGLAADGLARLFNSEAWPLAVIIPIVFAGLFLFSLMFDRLVDRVFPSGVRPARKPHADGGTPLLRLLSLPAGFALGVILAQFGLADAVFAVL